MQSLPQEQSLDKAHEPDRHGQKQKAVLQSSSRPPERQWRAVAPQSPMSMKSSRHQRSLHEFIIQSKERKLFDVNMEIAKCNIMDFNTFGLVTVLRVDMDGHMAVIGGDVAELAVANLSTTDADTNGMGIVAVEKAVGDGHPFAWLRIFQLARTRPQRKSVIARADVAVGDNDFAAAVDVNAVVLHHIRAVLNDDSLHGHIFTAIQKTCPSRRVFDGKVRKSYIGTFKEGHQLGRPPSFATPHGATHERMDNGMIHI